MSESEKDNVQVRWWPAMVILVCSALAIWQLHFVGLTLLKPIVDFYLAVAITNLLLYVWLRAWSNQSTSIQVVIGVAILAVQLATVFSLRLDGFDGTGRFIAKWRWTNTPEQNLAQTRTELSPRGTIDIGVPSEADSPAFRGEHRNGKYSLTNPKLDWEDCELRELWRRPMGRGWSSFAAVGKYCFTQEQLEDFEAVTCFELKTGEIAWQYELQARFDEVTSGPGPRATPAFAGNKLVAFGGTGILVCLNANDGTVIWTKRLCKKKEDEILFGFSSSPLIVDEKVFVTPGYPNDSVVCLDLNSGETLWAKDSRKAGYSSPQLFQHESGRSVLLFDAIGLHSYSISNGDLEWTFPWGDDSDEQVNVCQPCIVDNQHVLISSGYGRGCCLLKITRDKDQNWNVKSVWKTKRLKSKFASLLLHNDHIYGLDQGILTCLELANGQRKWKKGRYRHGQLILCNEAIVVQAELGYVAVVDANPQMFREVQRFKNALDDRTWNHPVIANNHLLIRNDREAVCFLITDRYSKSESD